MCPFKSIVPKEQAGIKLVKMVSQKINNKGGKMAEVAVQPDALV